jgi:ABC-type transport system involved in multi-copper enzyme maturation permease subunit
MKAWPVALNTYRGLLRGRILLFLLLLFSLTFLGFASGMFFAARLGEAGALEQSRLLFAHQIEGLLSAYAFFALVMATVAGAYVLPGEIKSGTIVPTLGRAVSRAQYLLGLFLGLNLLLATYVGLAVASIGGLLVWSGVRPDPQLLLGLLYVVLVANLWMGLTFLYSTLFGPLLALIAAVFTFSLPGMAEIVRLYSQEWSERLRSLFEHLLPAWNLIDYDAYLLLTRSPAARAASVHVMGIVHAVDYLAAVLLLAFLVFRRRSLLPPT